MCTYKHKPKEVSTHSRPKAAGRRALWRGQLRFVSTHSRPKAAGQFKLSACLIPKCFNTQPPEGGWHSTAGLVCGDFLFQHTAARRRLATATPCAPHGDNCFNTQPPEGGWCMTSRHVKAQQGFNTQPPEGGWINAQVRQVVSSGFNTQPPEGGWISP